MKKLICVEDVTQTHEKSQTIIVDQDTIITPAARDLIDSFQMSIKKNEKSEVSDTCLPEGLNKDSLIQLLKMILEEGSSSFGYKKHSNGLKVVQGDSVKMDVFDTGNPDAKVFFQELVSKEESKVSAGFLEIDHSKFDWKLTYEEIDYVINGTLEITIDEKTYTAHPGDIVFVPKNSQVTWGSPDKVKLFYATYPANWSD